jgi:exonuclease VII small subunit
MVMPEKTTLDLFNNALAELEQIVAELEVNEDSADEDNLDESLTEFEPNITNFESGVDLGFKNLSGLNVNITPKK